MRVINTSIPVLKQALDYRKGTDLSGTLIHPDGGKQFIEGNFLKLRDKHNMLIITTNLTMELEDLLQLRMKSILLIYNLFKELVRNQNY